MSEYKQAPEEIIKIAKGLIDLYHPTLIDASVGFLLKEKSPVSNGRRTLGKAKRVSTDMQAAGLDYDFIIWLAEDFYYGEATDHQRQALIDHELCHCAINAKGDATMVKHEIEEFNCIIQRYGFWSPSGHVTEEIVQQRLPMQVEGAGKVESVDLSRLKRKPSDDDDLWDEWSDALPA